MRLFTPPYRKETVQPDTPLSPELLSAPIRNDNPKPEMNETPPSPVIVNNRKR